jgi:hypothetical protein
MSSLMASHRWASSSHVKVMVYSFITDSFASKNSASKVGKQAALCVAHPASTHSLCLCVALRCSAQSALLCAICGPCPVDAPPRLLAKNFLTPIPEPSTIILAYFNGREV